MSSMCSLHQTVEEVDDQGLRYLLSEDSLETDIGERIDKFGHRFVVFAKINVFLHIQTNRHLKIINFVRLTVCA